MCAFAIVVVLLIALSCKSKSPITPDPTDIGSNDSESKYGIRVCAINADGNRDDLLSRYIGFNESESDGMLRVSLVSHSQSLPADLYLRVKYDSKKLSYLSAKYAGVNGGDILDLAAIRESGSIELAMARIRNDNASTGNILQITSTGNEQMLFNLEFAFQPEPALRVASKAPSGDANRVLNLTATDLNDNRVQLRWNEVNIGDYDNNGEVGVPDITPIAQNYLDTPSTTDNLPLFYLVDGDASGEIGVPDITPIANNYLAYITGYQVYRFDLGDTPLAPGTDSTPTIVRPAYTAEDGRLEYIFHDKPPATGEYKYTVRAFSKSDDSEPLGELSNEATVQFEAVGVDDHTPPVWDGATTAIDADAGSSSVELMWGRAADAESPPVDYLIYGSIGDTLNYGNPDIQMMVPVTDPDPSEHSVVIDNLTAGGTFTFGVRARDSAFTPNIDPNTETITVSLLGTIGWLDFRGGAGRTGAVGYSLNPPLIAVFQYQIDPTAGQSIATPAIVGKSGNIADRAICAVGGTVRALDLTDDDNIGEIWDFPTGGFIDSSPAVSAGRVFFGSRDHKFYCVDLDFGDEQWWFGTAGIVTASPVVVDDIVFMAGDNGDIFGLSIFNGDIIEQHTTDRPMSSSPAVVDGKIYVGTGKSASATGSIVCYDTQLDLRTLDYTTVGGVVATPAVADGYIVVGDLAGYVYVFSTANGAFLQSVHLDGGINASLCYANGIAYAATLNRKVYAIDVETGDFVWPQAATTVSGTFGIFSSPLLSSSYLYVAGSNGHISAIDITDGSVDSEWSGSSAAVTASVVAWGPRIYVQDNNNMLRAFTTNYDDTPPEWLDTAGITNVDWTGTLGEPVLRFTSGDGFDDETPPVKWQFYMSPGMDVDFANAGQTGSSTIVFGPYNNRIASLDAAGMTRAMARWVAHRAWYAARIHDSAIPPNYDTNEIIFDYTFPWLGEQPLVTLNDGDGIFQFDTAYDEVTGKFVMISFEYVEGVWRLIQRGTDGTNSTEIEHLSILNKPGPGYVDIVERETDDGSGGIDQTFFTAAVVPVDGSPVTRQLFVGETQSADADFEYSKIDTTDHNWGEVSIAVDKNGRPAVACPYMEDLEDPFLTATFWPRYHYLDDNDPPLWQHEFIGDTGEMNVQTWYMDLEFKSDGTPVVAFSKTDLTMTGKTGLFIAERQGANDWLITPVDGGDYAGVIGKHLSMVLDENDRPVILYTDLESEFFKLALPTGDHTWDLIELAAINNQGVAIHHETDLIKIDGGTLGTIYAAAHFSQFGTSKTYQKVIVHGFYKSGSDWVVPDDPYWLGEFEQFENNSCSITLVETERNLDVTQRHLRALFQDDFGKSLKIDSVESLNFLR